jgi:hypothetical protein
MKTDHRALAPGEAQKQRRIQKGVDAKDAKSKKPPKQGAMQAGARDYPTSCRAPS